MQHCNLSSASVVAAILCLCALLLRMLLPPQCAPCTASTFGATGLFRGAPPWRPPEFISAQTIYEDWRVKLELHTLKLLVRRADCCCWCAYAHHELNATL